MSQADSSREDIIAHIQSAIYNVVDEYAYKIQERINPLILALPDDELIYFLSKHHELNALHVRGISLDDIFILCRSRAVCQWIIDNMPIDDLEYLVDDKKDNEATLEQSTDSVEKEYLQWKIQLAQEWIALNHEAQDEDQDQ